MNFFEKDQRTALEAQAHAQFIAFGPVVFQVARAMRNFGILEQIGKARNTGLSLEEIARGTGIHPYGVRVLLEASLGIGLVTSKEGKYFLAKTGYFILHDSLTRINMDFVHHVCYKGLFDLDKSIQNGKPEGLKSFGEWPTIYAALASLPEHVRKSWFAFDHYFSDLAFPETLPLVYDGSIKKLLDIGGNTGKWAMASVQYDPDVQVTIMDLPGQLNDAEKKINEQGLQDRIHLLQANMLDEHSGLPSGFDVIWMSQFLDCFSEAEISSILKRCHDALSNDGKLYILEGFWDRQKFETAAFCLQQTSIYFTALANGNSQMYDSRVFVKLIKDAGFTIQEEIDEIGLSHTLLKCRKEVF
jgi:ubiquinone/menaquinone biosynthesis C-methylase UbiE